MKGLEMIPSKADKRKREGGGGNKQRKKMEMGGGVWRQTAQWK